MIDSPCINLCRMDPRSGYCAGCFRTLAEIAAWSAAPDAEKRAILDRVAGRAAALPPPLQGEGRGGDGFRRL